MDPLRTPTPRRHASGPNWGSSARLETVTLFVRTCEGHVVLSRLARVTREGSIGLLGLCLEGDPLSDFVVRGGHRVGSGWVNRPGANGARPRPSTLPFRPGRPTVTGGSRRPGPGRCRRLGRLRRPLRRCRGGGAVTRRSARSGSPTFLAPPSFTPSSLSPKSGPYSGGGSGSSPGRT